MKAQFIATAFTFILITGSTVVTKLNDLSVFINKVYSATELVQTASRHAPKIAWLANAKSRAATQEMLANKAKIAISAVSSVVSSKAVKAKEFSKVNKVSTFMLNAIKSSRLQAVKSRLSSYKNIAVQKAASVKQKAGTAKRMLFDRMRRIR